MLRPNSLAFTLLLAYLISFGPLSVDLYMPSVPVIGRVLDAPASRLQLTISLFLVAFAIGQIVYGPISDQLGRIPVLLAAFTLFCMASVVCATAPTVEMLILGRIGQGLGASAGPVVVRAIVRDLHEGVHAGRQLSLMNVFMGLVPIVGPLSGGLLLTLYGWRSSFVLHSIAGALAVLLIWRGLARTRPIDPPSVRELLGQYRVIATHPIFLANLAIGCLAYSGLYAWVAGSAFVMQNVLGLTPLQFSILYAASSAGFMAGGAISTRIVMRLGLDRTAGIGAVVVTLASAGMIAAVLFGSWLSLTLTVSMAVYLCGMGIVFPQSTAAGLTPFPKYAGVASALIGFSQQCSGALMGTAVGYSLGTTAWPVAIGLSVAGVGSLLMWVLTRKIRTASVNSASVG